MKSFYNLSESSYKDYLVKTLNHPNPNPEINYNLLAMELQFHRQMLLKFQVLKQTLNKMNIPSNYFNRLFNQIQLNTKQAEERIAKQADPVNLDASNLKTQPTMKDIFTGNKLKKLNAYLTGENSKKSFFGTPAYMPPEQIELIDQFNLHDDMIQYVHILKDEKLNYKETKNLWDDFISEFLNYYHGQNNS